jgi:hypothetical protein
MELLPGAEVGVFALKAGWDIAAGLDCFGVPMWRPAALNHCFACVAARDLKLGD